MGLVIGGKIVEFPGHNVLSWHDDPRWRLKIGEDGCLRRERWVRSIVCHTTMGLPARFLPGRGPSMGCDTAKCWSLDGRNAGAHLVVDMDATIYCLADLQLEAAYHATSVNQVSIGIEMRQGHGHGELYEDQVEACADLVVELCELFNIYPQLHYPYLHGPVPRLNAGGRDCVGVFGHRDQTANKGIGDPGDQIYSELLMRGFEHYNFADNEDIAEWKERQRRLNSLGWTPALTVDGIPGPRTMAAWKARGAETHNGYTEKTT